MSRLKSEVRERAWLYLSPEVAAAAGLSLTELQQFIAGTQALTDAQVQALASERYAIGDVGAAIASGSFQTIGMIIAPCSMGR